MNLSSIKLIIWDLDETLWKGTLSEEKVTLPERNSNLVKNLTDVGIVNSICSKNDPDAAFAQLAEFGLLDYFVFPSINWDNKGQRLKALIDKMALRPVNVLFIDDNLFNLQEAKHYVPDLQIAGPEILEEIEAQINGIPQKDRDHKRLKQYKLLEEKNSAAKDYDSNEDFLFASNIRVNICENCIPEKHRIHELIQRSNQLNYTKKRISLEQLENVLQDANYNCGYVTVRDNFWDYGIVGFYALTNNRLEHFVFSCRTMGMMIEQYIYAYLGFPELDVAGEVRTQLNRNDSPRWINQNESKKNTYNKVEIVKSCKILLKGPCDLSHAQSYIHMDNSIVSELTYMKGNLSIDTYNHSIHIKGLREYTDEDNQQIVADCPFVDPDMLHGSFFSGNYDIIFLSSLIESVYPVYRKKGSDIRVVYHQSGNDESCFFSEYENEGLTTPEQYLDFLKYCLLWLPEKTVLCIILGVSHPIKGFEETAARHKEINNVVKSLALSEKRIKFIDLDDIANKQGDFTDHINHFSARVYYEIAQAMLLVIKETTGVQMNSYGRGFVRVDNILGGIKRGIKRFLSPEAKGYKALSLIYRKLARK